MPDKRLLEDQIPKPITYKRGSTDFQSCFAENFKSQDLEYTCEKCKGKKS